MSLDDWERDRARDAYEKDVLAAAAAVGGQLPLELGSFYTDGKPEFHGAQAGVARHTRLGEPLCPPCQEWVEELAAAGLVKPIGPAPQVDPARLLNEDRVPARSPYQLHDWVQLHGFLGAMPGPRQLGFRGYVTGYIGATILTGVTDDGRDWSEYWGALVPDGTPNRGVVACTCCPQQRRR